MVDNFSNLKVNSQEKATFAVQVEVPSKRNWKGTVTWMETQQETEFKSVMELLGAIENTIKIVSE